MSCGRSYQINKPIENSLVVDKAGLPATSLIWPIPPHAFEGIDQIVLLTGSPVLSTTISTTIYTIRAHFAQSINSSLNDEK